MALTRDRRSGFTLVELLVVIAIIVILAAVIMPVYTNSQERARQAQCLSNMHGIGLAMKLYKNTYRAYPAAALDRAWNQPVGDPNYSPGLLDGPGGNAAYVATAYNTYDDAVGRRSRINALYPNYLEEQKGLICPDEDEDSYLIDGVDGAAALNGSASSEELSVRDAGPFSASTYDDFYNAFGYASTSTVTVSLGPGTPRVDRASELAGGRKARRLNNRYAPGSTIITYCREHETFYDKESETDPRSAISLVVRLDGGTERVIRAEYDWNTQAESRHE